MKKLISSVIICVLLLLVSSSAVLADDYTIGMVVDGEAVTLTVIIDGEMITATTNSSTINITSVISTTKELSTPRYVEQMNKVSAVYAVVFTDYWNFIHDINNDADARSLGKLTQYNIRANYLYSVIKSANDEFKSLIPPAKLSDIHNVAIDAVIHADRAISILVEWTDIDRDDYDNLLSGSMDEAMAAADKWFPNAERAKSIMVGLASIGPVTKPTVNPKSGLNSKVPSLSALNKSEREVVVNYATVVGDILKTYDSFSTQMDLLFNQAKEKPSIIYSDTWQDDLMSQLAVVQLAVDRTKELSPPVYFHESHDLMIEAAEHLSLFSTWIKVWLNNGNEASLSTAVDNLEIAGDALIRAKGVLTAVLDQLND